MFAECPSAEPHLWTNSPSATARASFSRSSLLRAPRSRALFALGLALTLIPVHLSAESVDGWQAYQTALQSENCSTQIDHLNEAIRLRGEPNLLPAAGGHHSKAYFHFISLAEAYEDCNELDLAHKMVLIAISRGDHLVPRMNPPGNLRDRERRRWEYQITRSRQKRIGELRARLQEKRDLLANNQPEGIPGEKPNPVDSPQDGSPPLGPIPPEEPTPTDPDPQLPIEKPDQGPKTPVEVPLPETQGGPLRPEPRPELRTGPTAVLQIGHQLRITCSDLCKFLPKQGAIEVGVATWILPRGYHQVWIDGKEQPFPKRRDLSYDRDLRAMEALLTASREDRLRLSFGHENGSSEEHRVALRAIPTAWATGALMFSTMAQGELYRMAQLSRIQEIAALKTSDLTSRKARLLVGLAGLEAPSDPR